MDCEQLEYILDLVSSEEDIEVDFYAYNGMPLGCIDSTTRVWSTEKGLLIIDNGQYTYFINIADLSHVIVKNRNEEVYESINKVEQEILPGKNWIVFNCSDDCDGS